VQFALLISHPHFQQVCLKLLEEFIPRQAIGMAEVRLPVRHTVLFFHLICFIINDLMKRLVHFVEVYLDLLLQLILREHEPLEVVDVTGAVLQGDEQLAEGVELAD